MRGSSRRGALWPDTTISPTCVRQELDVDGARFSSSPSLPRVCLFYYYCFTMFHVTACVLLRVLLRASELSNTLGSFLLSSPLLLLSRKRGGGSYLFFSLNVALSFLFSIFLTSHQYNVFFIYQPLIDCRLQVK